MQFYEQGREYWEITRRYHLNRNNPALLPVALREMRRLQQRCTSKSVLMRISSFIANHPVKPANGDGPLLA